MARCLPMASSPKRPTPHARPDEQQLRDQEVLRANRELAAYFKGRRTEREARAAVKIIKAFIRDRERIDPAKRRPLPGAPPPAHSTDARKGGDTDVRMSSRRRGVADVRPLSIAELKSDTTHANEPSSSEK
jgi:hypothetical protein